MACPLLFLPSRITWFFLPPSAATQQRELAAPLVTVTQEEDRARVEVLAIVVAEACGKKTQDVIITAWARRERALWCT